MDENLTVRYPIKPARWPVGRFQLRRVAWPALLHPSRTIRSVKTVTEMSSPNSPRAEVPHRPVVIFDGDDTLWLTEPLYDKARSEASEIVARAGIDPLYWDQLERLTDVQNVPQFGYSAARFPTSCVQAYYAAAQQLLVPVSQGAAGAVQSAASSVFKAVAPLARGAEDALAELSKDYDLILYTQGDSEIQRKRIADSGLTRYFRFLIVVPRKSSDELASLLRKLRVPAEQTVFVGNSLRSDIYPALANGMNAIWIDRHVWEYEHVPGDLENVRLFQARDLHEIPGLVRNALLDPIL